MLAIKGGRILTITMGILEDGMILIDDGKILDLGFDLSIPEDAQTIDATGKTIMPGMIDAHTHLGIHEEGLGWEGDDVNERTEPVTPHLRAIDGINPEDQGLKDALEAGVTSVMVNPGSANVIGGQSVAIKTFGKIVDRMVLKNPAGIKMAFGENPKRIYGQDQKKAPATRMAVAGMIREWLTKAKDYAEKRSLLAGIPEKMPERDVRLDALMPVIKRELPARIHAHRADDIMTAIRIADEFHLDITIEHATEAHKIADELSIRRIPAVVGPLITSRSKVELRDRTPKTPALLTRAGVKVALTTDHPVIPIKALTMCAAVAVKEGMPEEEALKAVTINAAEIMGVANRVGSLERGKDADVIILSGHPFDLRTNVELTIVNGQIAYKGKAFSES